MNEPRQREETILEAVIALPPDKRAGYLDQACGKDPQMRQRIEGLIQAHEKAGAFMAQPAAPQPGPTVRVSVPLTEKPGDKIGHYKLLQQVGEGGCGVVYMAEQQEPIKRRVAFKVIKLGMDTKQVIARFEAERQALALMDHPNIAKVLDAGATDTGRPYFVMELVRGIKLTDYCDQNNLPTEQRLDLFMQVCHAIQHAHQKGIIHRDIKPSNILVTINDGVPVPKVIDFGIAKATGGQQLTDKTLFTAFEQFVGTPAYMSPEQAEMTSLDIDTRSDIYALGVLLYELLTGHTPFDPKTLLSAGLDEMRRIIREQEPDRPSTRLSSLDAAEQTTVAKRRQSEPPKLIHQLRGDLDWIVMKCLEKDRTRRYETANALAMDLQHHLSDEPVSARPPTARYRLSRLMRRHRLEFAAAAGFVALLLVATLVSTTLAVWANRQKARALSAEQDAKAVLNFLEEKILAAARPEGQEGGLGPDVTVRRAVQAAESQIASSFTNRPLVEAAIRHSLGVTFDCLGDISNAVPQFERALKLRQRHLSPEHPETLTTMAELASTYRQSQRFQQAIELNQEALRLRSTTLGPRDPATIRSMILLALAYRSAGRPKEALPLHEEALKLAQAALGADDPLTLMAMNSLASAYRDAGRHAEAVPLLEQTLALRKARLGPDNPGTLVTMSDLARAYAATGRTAEYISLYEQIVRVRRAKLGPDHPNTLQSMVQLALSYADDGRIAESASMYEEVLRLRRAKLGPDHPETVRSLMALAWTYRLAGRWSEALALRQEVVRQREATLGTNHPDTIEAIANLGLTHLGAGQLPEALRVLQTGFSRAESLSRTNRAKLALMQSMAAYYQQTGDRSESAKWRREWSEGLRESLEGASVTALNDAAWKLATGINADARDGRAAVTLAERAVRATNRKDPAVLDTLAAAWAEAGDFAKAVTVQQEAIALLHIAAQTNDYTSRLKLYDSKIPYHDRAALAESARTLLAAGKFAEAEPWARECLAIRQVQMPDNWLTFNARSMLGGSLLGQKQYAEAEPLLLAGYEGMAQRADKIPAENKPRLRDALQRLVQLYETTDRPEQAAKWKEDLARLHNLPVAAGLPPPPASPGTTNATSRAP